VEELSAPSRGAGMLQFRIQFPSFSTPRLLDFLSSSFVFIDILALFPRFVGAIRRPTDGCPRAATRDAPKVIIDLFNLPFVFIDIPGSFLQFWKSRGRESKSRGADDATPRTPLELAVVFGRRLVDFSTSRLLDLLSSSFVFIDILALFPRFVGAIRRPTDGCPKAATRAAPTLLSNFLFSPFVFIDI